MTVRWALLLQMENWGRCNTLYTLYYMLSLKSRLQLSWPNDYLPLPNTQCLPPSPLSFIFSSRLFLQKFQDSSRSLRSVRNDRGLGLPLRNDSVGGFLTFVRNDIMESVRNDIMESVRNDNERGFPE